jgi:hypothetical protein
MSNQLFDISGWQKKVEDRAIGFAGHVMHRFNQSVDGSIQLLPSEFRRPQAYVVVDVFLDAFIGAIAGVAMQYAGSSALELEEQVVTGFRHKFQQMRLAAAKDATGTERQMEKAAKRGEDTV